VDNAGDTAVVTRLRLIPLDASAHVLRGVKVTTLFGTDRERTVIPRGSTYDILRFSGPGFRRVAVAGSCRGPACSSGCGCRTRTPTPSPCGS
jgi:hypothetical protein